MSSLTCLGVDHQNVGSGPEHLLEVFVVADLLYERRHLHRLQHRQQPYLNNHTQTQTQLLVNHVCDERGKESKAGIGYLVRFIYFDHILLDKNLN